MLLVIFSTAIYFGKFIFHPQIFRLCDGWILVEILYVILHIM